MRPLSYPTVNEYDDELGALGPCGGDAEGYVVGTGLKLYEFGIVAAFNGEGAV
jgi:hypothetical protein